jgi:FAD/FMN-containing dehydrogenase
VTMSAAFDFPVTGSTSVTSAEELAEFLRSRQPGDDPIRLCGTGSRQRELPAPGRPVHVVSLRKLDRITRLDAEDLTCSVEPGILRADLDRALSEVGLRLVCPRSRGTLGGLFALGREGLPLAPGPLATLGARALLLGMSAVLGEGVAFRSGARVVKSVAGFDLHKLFVGSRGRICAATELHLKLRPMPRAAETFEKSGLGRDEALDLFRALRLDDAPPVEVELACDDPDGPFRVRGRLEGAAAVIRSRMTLHGLDAVDPREPADHAADPRERLFGLVPPSQLGQLLSAAPPGAAIWCDGTGGFALRPAAPADTDALLSAFPGLGITAEIDLAAPARRGSGTPRDPGALRVEERLTTALDPGEVFA